MLAALRRKPPFSQAPCSDSESSPPFAAGTGPTRAERNAATTLTCELARSQILDEVALLSPESFRLSSCRSAPPPPERREAAVVVEAALARVRVPERRRPVSPGGERLAGSRRCRSPPARRRFCPGSRVHRRHVAACAAAPLEDQPGRVALQPRRTIPRRRRRRERQLVDVERRQLRRDQVRAISDVAEPAAATGYFTGSSSRASRRLPLPCICGWRRTRSSRSPTEPVYVARFTPASPNAGGMRIADVRPSGRNALPSKTSTASNLPGPQLASTLPHRRLVDAQHR